MSLQQFTFLLLGATTLGAAVMVVSLRNIVHAALSLALCFAGVAGLYILLQAEFLAVAQVLIYIGAITVLLLFAIMLTRHLTNQHFPALVSHWKWGLAGALAFLALLLHVVTRGIWQTTTQTPADSTTSIGLALVTRYVLPFELASLILLVAVVGAAVLARDERR